ncbi:MAG TPA: beta-ketoacyl-[acyl-carrier-protein] synthase family protein [Thermomicrobiales bacterium]|nr:beta-ketoacyl-[acyl-carrier-protein] synthase family protein [Thermomicrobiales bacterium]
MRRVVITGLGVIAPNGNGKEAFWDACVKGVSGAGSITRFDASKMTSRMACEVRDFDPRAWGLTEYEATYLDRHAQFALAAAGQALADADLEAARLDRERVGVYVGSTNASPDTFEATWERATNRGAERMVAKPLPPELYFGLLSNASSASVATHYGFMGPSAVISDACSSGMDAVEQARHAILDGYCDVALAGGSDASVTPLGLAGYCVLGAVSRRNDDPLTASRPFDRDRDGFVLGEGAAMVILEELEHARRRGATIYGEVLGVSTNTNAYHMTALPADGGPLAAVMRAALTRAGKTPADVGYLNAHGTSTPVNDRSETAAAKAAFGEWAPRIPISSTKGVIGHTQGAASAHQMVVLCMTLRDGVLHPTINYQNPDPDCDLDYVPNVAREARVDVVMANACGFGGINSSIVVGRYEK